jgi:phenylacetate-CoA ligase
MKQKIAGKTFFSNSLAVLEKSLFYGKFLIYHYLNIMENNAMSKLKIPASVGDVCAKDYLEPGYLRDLQLYRLKNTIQHCYDNVQIFRQRMDNLKLKPGDIKKLDDISKLPFTTKFDLRDNYPFGLCAVPMNQIVRLHASSGTTGKPIVVAYTQHDLDVWTESMARSLNACGVTQDDIVQVSYGYGLFTGGLGAHYGSEFIGATVVPTSVGNTQRQLMVMQDFGVTVICCTPSYFTYLMEKAAESGINLKDTPLRVGIFGAEPWSAEMRKHIENGAGISAHDIYGLSEISGPGVSINCGHGEGLHIFEDNFYPEIIDPDTGEPLPDGQIGELVFTTINKYGMPMIRYRTRDLSSLITERCPCGRTIRRMQRISSRTDDMLIIRGVNVFPSQIESALLAVEGTQPHYNIILFTEHGLDQIEVAVEVTQELFNDQVREMEKLQHAIASSIEHVIGLRVRVKLVAPQTIQRSEGKARRVIDRRER